MARTGSAAETIYRLVRESVALQDRIRMLEGRLETVVGQCTRMERLQAASAEALAGLGRSCAAQGAELAKLAEARRRDQRTIERLIREKDGILQACGGRWLSERGYPTRPEPPAAGQESFSEADLDRYYAELRKLRP